MDSQSAKLTFALPFTLQQHMLQLFQAAQVEDHHLSQCSSYLDLLKVVSLNTEITESLMEILGNMVTTTLDSSGNASPKSTFSLGVGLEALLRLGSFSTSWKQHIWPELCKQAEKLGRMPVFIKNLLSFLQSVNVEPGPELEMLVRVLTQNLSSSQHELRDLSLRLLSDVHRKQFNRESEVLRTALTIENTPLNLQLARTISMHVRKLSSHYKDVSSDPWLGKMIVYFCFGLLNFKLSQVWDDAISVLKSVCESRTGEDVVFQIAFQWLTDVTPSTEEVVQLDQGSAQKEHLNEFQCTEHRRMEELARTSAEELGKAAELLEMQYEAKARPLSAFIPELASRALRVLNSIPHVAERYSRRVVPLFLQWAVEDEGGDHDDAEDGETEPNMPATTGCKAHRSFDRKDRKAMLDLFSRFTNPRALYGSPRVFECLLHLLTNGDNAIQKSALNAIFTWKLAGILPYQENLINILDDARFREEISTFLEAGVQGAQIRNDHRGELSPVLLRLLYGRIVTRSGAASKSGQTVRRRAVFEALARLPQADQKAFVEIALGSLGDLVFDGESIGLRGTSQAERVTPRKQFGLVNMVSDLLEILGEKLSFLIQPIIKAVLYCAISSEKELFCKDGGDSRDQVVGVQLSLRRKTRQVSLRCLTILFKLCLPEEIRSYLPIIFAHIVNPRLENLAIETAQAISGILHLFAAWASSPETAIYLAQYNGSLLRNVVDCLSVPSAKDEVKLFVINNILKQLIPLNDPDENIEASSSAKWQIVETQVVRPDIEYILHAAGGLLRKSPSKELLSSAISLVSMLAPIISTSLQAQSFLDISNFLLNQPSQRVSPRSKGDLLRMLQHFIPLVQLERKESLQQDMLCTVSSLFGYFTDRTNRSTLCEILLALSQSSEDLKPIAGLCLDLNAFSAKSLEDPDFDRRLRAFNLINESMYATFSPNQWQPIIYNMLYYIRDGEELAIRSNASLSLKRYIETHEILDTTTSVPSHDLLKSVILPSLRSGAAESSELIRTEYLALMAHVVRKNPDWPEVRDMIGLLVNDDEEASFFNNILHIQQHRRLRALKRLASEARSGHLGSSNVAHFLIPLVEHFIFDKADDESAHNLAAEATTTIGALAERLEWPQLRAMLRRYSGYVRSKPDLEKTTIKLLGVVIDALDHAAKGRSQLSVEGPDIIQDQAEIPKSLQSTLSKTLPREDRLTSDITENLLPPLMAYLHDKDESTVSLRVPVAVSIIKVLNILPTNEMTVRLPAVLTDVCNILRSRAQESRDMTRKTLVEISTIIGPSCLGFILKELKSSLARGYQLHVLSYTVHSILVATAPIFRPGDVDYCLPQIVSVILDDIFGTTGQEKDAEEYISKMKEVKSSKSYDSMELIAKTATVGHLAHLIRPLQTLLDERMDLRMIKKADELLRRIGVGLLRNADIESREILVFCYEVIQAAYKEDTLERTKTEEYRVKRFLVNSKSFKVSATKQATTSYKYKLARFALDILRAVLHKFDILQTPSNLVGFLPLIEDSLIHAQEEVQMSALRLLAAIIKVPLKEIDEKGASYVSQAVKLVKDTISTNTELAQASLKLVSAVLRERRNVEVKESELAYLLTRLKSDLDEPDRQGVTFNFLKAVVARRVMIPEVYDVLDSVAAMMVTNQTQGARDLARSLYFQFILNYPQSKERWAKQLGFLLKNLDYKHPEGRQSVMEAIHMLITKIGDGLAQELVEKFFVPLTMLITNDESADCRKIGGELLKELIQRADEERLQNMLSLLRTWLGQEGQVLLVRVALQIYGIYLDVQGANTSKEISLLQERITYILEVSNAQIVIDEWEVLYFALNTAAKLCQIFHETLFRTSSASLWVSVRKCLDYPHAWIKLAGAKLLGIYFADFARTNAGIAEVERPLRGSGGLRLGDEELLQIAKSSLKCLRVPGVSEELAAQIVRNVVFLGRFMNEDFLVTDSTQPAELLQKTGDKDEERDDSEDDSADEIEKSAIQFLFERLSAILRREPINTRASALVPKTAALQVIAALCNHLSIPTLSSSIETILLPLHNLTDTSIPAPYSSDEDFRKAHQNLVSTSQEIMALLQKKLGTTGYINHLAKVREGVKERREGRRVKRRLEAVAQPEKAGRDKKRKGEKKKEKRKERSGEHRGLRRGW